MNFSDISESPLCLRRNVCFDRPVSRSSKHAVDEARSSKANNSKGARGPSKVRNTLGNTVGKSTVDSRHDNGNPHSRHESGDPLSPPKDSLDHVPLAKRSAAR